MKTYGTWSSFHGNKAIISKWSKLRFCEVDSRLAQIHSQVIFFLAHEHFTRESPTHNNEGVSKAEWQNRSFQQTVYLAHGGASSSLAAWFRGWLTSILDNAVDRCGFARNTNCCKGGEHGGIYVNIFLCSAGAKSGNLSLYFRVVMSARRAVALTMMWVYEQMRARRVYLYTRVCAWVGVCCNIAVLSRRRAIEIKRPFVLLKTRPSAFQENEDASFPDGRYYELFHA